ncbi:MAG: helix-turn-helix transcriptional regulator [Bacteroidota bacterium]
MELIPILEHPKEVMQFTKAAPTPRFNDFFIMRHEDALPSNLKRTPPHKRQCFDITIITNCDYERSINESTKTHKGDFITFVGPFQTHSYSLPEEKPTGFSIFFTNSFASLGSKNTNFLRDFPFFGFRSNEVIPLGFRDKNFMISLFEKIHSEYHNNKKADFALVKAYLNVLLLEIKRLYSKKPKSSQVFGRSNHLTSEFMMMLESSSTRYNSLTEYADALNISPRYLSETLKKSTGKTARFHIQQRLIVEAKSLLTQTSLSSSEISYILEFKDTSHFCRFFKQHTGKSPQIYRNTK